MEKINQIFDKLDEWRHLPSYQLERRFDIFLSIYLSQIIEKYFKTTISKIIPEFPFRTGDIKINHRRPNKSYKIDYLAISEISKQIYLIELKTDSESIRQEQIEMMKKVSKYSCKKMTDGIIKIYNESKNAYLKYKTKHQFLLEMLTKSDIGWVEKKENDYISICSDYEKKIVFIQPKVIKEYTDISIITFEDIIKLLDSENDLLLERIKQSLKTWINDPVN